MDDVQNLTPTLTFRRTGTVIKVIPPLYEVILVDHDVPLTKNMTMDEIHALFAKHGLEFKPTWF